MDVGAIIARLEADKPKGGKPKKTNKQRLRTSRSPVSTLCYILRFNWNFCKVGTREVTLGAILAAGGSACPTGRL
jgi:hypothetical protein